MPLSRGSPIPLLSRILRLAYEFVGFQVRIVAGEKDALLKEATFISIIMFLKAVFLLYRKGYRKGYRISYRKSCMATRTRYTNMNCSPNNFNYAKCVTHAYKSRASGI
jgi:hypothetical protein